MAWLAHLYICGDALREGVGRRRVFDKLVVVMKGAFAALKRRST